MEEDKESFFNKEINFLDSQLTQQAQAELKFENGEITIENSPLAQADPTALDELFTRIDTSIKLGNIPDEADVFKTTLVLRQQRQKFLNLEAQKVPKSAAEKKSIAERTKASAKGVKSVKQALSINDL